MIIRVITHISVILVFFKLASCTAATGLPPDSSAFYPKEKRQTIIVDDIKLNGFVNPDDAKILQKRNELADIIDNEYIKQNTHELNKKNRKERSKSFYGRNVIKAYLSEDDRLLEEDIDALRAVSESLIYSQATAKSLDRVNIQQTMRAQFVQNKNKKRKNRGNIFVMREFNKGVGNQVSNLIPDKDGYYYPEINKNNSNKLIKNGTIKGTNAIGAYKEPVIRKQAETLNSPIYDKDTNYKEIAYYKPSYVNSNESDESTKETQKPRIHQRYRVRVQRSQPPNQNYNYNKKKLNNIPDAEKNITKLNNGQKSYNANSKYNEKDSKFEDVLELEENPQDKKVTKEDLRKYMEYKKYVDEMEIRLMRRQLLQFERSLKKEGDLDGVEYGKHLPQENYSPKSNDSNRKRLVKTNNSNAESDPKIKRSFFRVQKKVTIQNDKDGDKKTSYYRQRRRFNELTCMRYNQAGRCVAYKNVTPQNSSNMTAKEIVKKSKGN